MATGHEIAMGLRAAYLLMHRQTNAQLASCDVTADQFVLLVLLGERDGITQRELVQRASSDANTVRAMLVLLEDRGLVARSPHPTDGRARVVTLTKQGRCVVEEAFQAVKPLREQLFGLFEGDESGMLLEFLERITEAMRLPDHRRGRSPSADSPAAAHRSL